MDLDKVGSFIRYIFLPDDPVEMGFGELLVRIFFYAFLFNLGYWGTFFGYLKIKKMCEIYKQGLVLEARKKKLKVKGDDDVEMKLLNNSDSRKIEIRPKAQTLNEKTKDNNVEDAEMKPLTSKSKEIEIRPKVQTLNEKTKDNKVDDSDMKPLTSQSKEIEVQPKVHTLNEKSKTFKVEGLDVKSVGSQSITVTLRIKANKKKSEKSGFSTQPIGDVSMFPPTAPPLPERPHSSLLFNPAFGDVSMFSPTVPPLPERPHSSLLPAFGEFSPTAPPLPPRSDSSLLFNSAFDQLYGQGSNN